MGCRPQARECLLEGSPEELAQMCDQDRQGPCVAVLLKPGKCYGLVAPPPPLHEAEVLREKGQGLARGPGARGLTGPACPALSCLSCGHCVLPCHALPSMLPNGQAGAHESPMVACRQVDHTLAACQPPPSMHALPPPRPLQLLPSPPCPSTTSLPTLLPSPPPSSLPAVTPHHLSGALSHSPSAGARACVQVAL